MSISILQKNRTSSCPRCIASFRAAVVDDMDVKTGQPLLAGPLLRLVE